MPRRLIFKEGSNLSNTGSVQSGYKMVGYEGNSFSQKVLSTISSIGGSPFQYEIGEYVSSEGGVIFHRYLTGSTQSYLVVDTQDLSSGIVWSNIDNVLIGVSAQSKWNGSGNTTAITTQSGATTGAAFLCEGSPNNGKSDWYLPAIQELNKLWCNMLEVSKGLEIAGGSQLTFGLYWSSTEHFNSLAWSFNFYFGIPDYDYNKDFTFYVRAVRQFSI